MAELTLFGYRTGQSVVHRCDARVKLALMAILSLLSLNAGWVWLLGETLCLLVLLGMIRFRFFTFLRGFKFFGFFLLVLCLIRGMVTPGSNLSWTAIPLSVEGIQSGALFGWRLILMVWIGMVVTSTTQTDHIRSAVEWYLSPIPGLPNQRIGLLIGLQIRFIPLILMQIRRVDEAQRARGVENRRNPIYRMSVYTMAVMRVTFKNADQLATAMQARSYGASTPPLE